MPPEIVIYTLAGAIASGIAFYVLFAGRVATKRDTVDLWKGVSDRSKSLGERIDSLKDQTFEIAKKQEHMMTADSQAFPWLKDKANVEARLNHTDQRLAEITKELTENSVAHARLFGLLEAIDKKLDHKLDAAIQYNKFRDRRAGDRQKEDE